MNLPAFVHPASAQTLSEYFEILEQQLTRFSLEVCTRDSHRPWGGFLVFPEAHATEFARLFFPDTRLDTQPGALRLSPKILVVRPGTRLSWQYHHRRSELWRPVLGPVGVVTSPNDSHGPLQTLKPGTTLSIPVGVRHRLVGMDCWGVVAEIWQHTVPGHPSDEDDIVRLSDDFGRGIAAP